jgi:hypothetical protein
MRSWDNAVVGSFFDSLEVEAMHGSDIESRREMEQDVFDYVERFISTQRWRARMGYRSPKAFEQQPWVSLAAERRARSGGSLRRCVRGDGKFACPPGDFGTRV